MNQYPPPSPRAINPATYGVRPAPALVQQLLIGAFGWMFAGLLLTAGVSFVVSTSAAITQGVVSLWLPLLIGLFALAMVIQAAINRVSPLVSLLLFFVYAAMMGLTIGVIVQIYTTESVAAAFLSSAGMFGGAAAYGAITKRDLSSIGGIMVMALIGLIVAMVVNFFLQSTQVGWIISIIGVLLFVGLTAWDVQRITTGQYAAMVRSAERASVLAALHLYLDFVNLFLFLLQLFGSRR